TRRCEDQLPRPWQQPGRDFEPGILLAYDEDPAVLVGLDRTEIAVVGHRLEAGDGRPVGVRNADGKDDDGRAVVAVRRGEDEILAVSTRGFPPSSVPHPDPGALGKRFKASLHLRPRREVGCP